jgi:hypothetical protein
MVDQKSYFCYNITINYKNGAIMSATTLKQYTNLLIRAEAARAVGDFEDYFVLQAEADRLTRNS